MRRQMVTTMYNNEFLLLTQPRLISISTLEETILCLKKNMQKIGVAFSGPIYGSHHLLFKTLLSFMIKAKLRAY